MERQKSYSPSPQLKASLKFTHKPQTDPVRSGAIFRQGAQSGDGEHEQQTSLHQTAPSSEKVEDLRGGFEQRVQQYGKSGLEINPAAVNSRAATLSGSAPEWNQALIAPGTVSQHSLAPGKVAPVADSSAIIRPAPYGRFVPQPSPTPFGVAAWASSVGHQISANFDALVRQSPAPRVLREHAHSPPHFYAPPGPQHEGFSHPQRSGGSDASRLMPPPRESPRHALKQEVQRQATFAQPDRGAPPASHIYEGKGDADSSRQREMRSSPRAQGMNESESANGVAETPAAVSPTASGSGVRETGLALPANQGGVGAGSRSDGASGSKAPAEEGPLPEVAHEAKEVELNLSESVPTVSPVVPGKSPILNPGFQTPVSLQPGSVLRSHSELKKGAASDTRGGTSDVSDHDAFSTPDNTTAGATPFTRSRLKAAQSPAKTPLQARAEKTPQTHEKQVTPVQETGIPGSTGRTLRGSSGRPQARGLSAFLEDEGDEDDPAFSLDVPPPEDEPPGPVAEGALGGGVMPKLPAGGGVAEEKNGEAEGEVGRGNRNDDGGKDDSERTESDRPNRDGLNGGGDEAAEVNSGGAVLPRTPRNSGKRLKGVRNSAGKTPEAHSGKEVGLQEGPVAVGSAERTNSVRRSSRGVQAGVGVSPLIAEPKAKEVATPKPSTKSLSPGSTQKPLKTMKRTETASPQSPQPRDRNGKFAATGSLAVNPRSADREERLAKRRKLSEEDVEKTVEKEAEHGGRVGAGEEKGEKSMEEGPTGAGVVPKEEGDAKRMSESKKRSRMLRELESRLKGPEDEVIITRAVKLPEAAQVSRWGRLVKPKLAFWENEYYDRDHAGRIVGISRPPEYTTPSKKPQNPKPFSPKLEPVVKSENTGSAADSAERKQKLGASKEATHSKRKVKVEDDVSTPQDRGQKRKGAGGMKGLGGAETVVKKEGGDRGQKSPVGSPGRWVSTRNKRKRMEGEETKTQERVKKGETKTDPSGSGKEESHPSKKRKGAAKGENNKASELSGSVGGPKPSGSVSGSQPSDPSGRRKSSDQLWRLNRQHKVQKGPRAANFVGDGFVADTAEVEEGANGAENEGGQNKRDEEGTEGPAAEGVGGTRENGGPENHATDIGGSKGGESEEQKSGVDVPKDGGRVDRRLRSRGQGSVQEDTGKKIWEGGSRLKRGKEAGPVAGLGDDLKRVNKRDGKLQGPVEDLRRQKKERRIDELLVEDKSGTAEDESTETKRKKLKKGSEAKSGSSKSKTAVRGGGRKATRSKSSADERGPNGDSALEGDDVSKKGTVKEGGVISGAEATGPTEGRYPRRRLRKKGELERGASEGGASVENEAKAVGTEEKSGTRNGSNPSEAIDALRKDQTVTTGFEDPEKGREEPIGDAKPGNGVNVEETAEEVLETGEERGDEAAGVEAPVEGTGAELDEEAATALGVGLTAEDTEKGSVEKEKAREKGKAPNESDLGADEAAEQLGMGAAENTFASVSAKDGAPSTGEQHEEEASLVPIPEEARAESGAEQEGTTPKGSVADARQGHVLEEQQGHVADVGVGNEGTVVAGLVHTVDAEVGGVSGKGPSHKEKEGPVHTSGLEALPTDNVPSRTPQPAIAKGVEPIPTIAAEPSATGVAGLVHTDGAGPVHTATEDEPVDATGWTASQVAALKSALLMIDPTVDGLWYKVARQVPGKNHIECQTKHNEAYVTPPVRPPYARRAGMSPAPRIILQGAGRGLAKAANQSKPRGTIVSVQMQGMRAAREILRAQQAKQRAEAGDPLAFHVAESDGTRSNDLGMAPDGGSVPAASPLILKPVQNQDKYIDDALQRRLQAQRRKNATSQGGSGAQTLKSAAPVLGFEGVTRETVTGGAAGVVAAAEKALVLREQAANSMEDEPEGLAGGDEEEEDEDDPPPFA
ncbi:hypothetical protein KFL_000260110 [Klebsormidium nitens]|uniref:Myb-like domain-containing protein n=1 Tax=Klebsormidium nitens TaxID=105231 RepID=A0A1Y1HRJ1_KLENI|nr:hypothetical protein KFL_000260110 [Klebsormidium nitens]|eukprot:GAQ79196.1 hypothetical protein KFL_000260110 [Klebsormidium nitens]